MLLTAAQSVNLPIMQNKDPINEFIKSAEHVIPRYVYGLADYKHERLMSTAPINTGDYVTVRLSSGDILQKRKVKRVCHYPSPVSESGQILEAYIELEDA
jgi:hypothetical protein